MMRQELHKQNISNQRYYKKEISVGQGAQDTDYQSIATRNVVQQAFFYTIL